MSLWALSLLALSTRTCGVIQGMAEILNVEVHKKKRSKMTIIMETEGEPPFTFETECDQSTVLSFTAEEISLLRTLTQDNKGRGPEYADMAQRFSDLDDADIDI